MGRNYLGKAFGLVATSCVLLVRVEFASAITIQTVPVGNVGNAPEVLPIGSFGSVNYAYNIGQYDVTVGQYTAFLNAVAAADPYGVYNSNMADTSSGNPGITQSTGPSGSYSYSVAAGRGNYPVTDVSFWDATRFANWLSNGQPTGPEGAGTTETGAYTLTPASISNNSVTRNAGATWAVTSEDEWYKAAYYSPALNGGAGGYWLYPTQSDTISTSQANYGGAVGDTTPVGSYAYPSYYGTYDEGGDVFQWNETIYSSVYEYRKVRGGAFGYMGGFLQSGDNFNFYPTTIVNYTGFRVSQVPEPASLGILSLGVWGMLSKRRR